MTVFYAEHIPHIYGVGKFPYQVTEARETEGERVLAEVDAQWIW